MRLKQHWITLRRNFLIRILLTRNLRIEFQTSANHRKDVKAKAARLINWFQFLFQPICLEKEYAEFVAKEDLNFSIVEHHLDLTSLPKLKAKYHLPASEHLLEKGVLAEHDGTVGYIKKCICDLQNSLEQNQELCRRKRQKKKTMISKPTCGLFLTKSEEQYEEHMDLIIYFS